VTRPAPILLTIAFLWLAAVVTPGPNFLLTTRTALLHDRTRGVEAALGVASGAVVWGLAGFFGIHVLFFAAPWLYLTLRVGGSLFLVFSGAKMLLGSFREAERVALSSSPRPRSAYPLGLITSVTNPQSALSTASLFAATLPVKPSLALGFEAIAVMASISASWYVLVACVLSAAPIAAVFLRIRRWVDRAAGLAFMAFGARLALERSR
jgi:threonine efflux protein